MRKNKLISFLSLLLMGSLSGNASLAADLWSEVEHHYVDSNGVNIHYTALGDGPLVVMIHGFPDFWYTWRHQMAGLKDEFRVVAIDQRGYNRSGRPDGVENYDMSLLVADVAAVVRDQGQGQATIVGHDWGGVVAWMVAYNAPEIVNNLIILNLPHPNGLARSRAANPDVLSGTLYAKVFREGTPDDPEVFFGVPMTSQNISGWVSDPLAREKYIEAFDRSDFTAMLNYYKRNYPDVWNPEYVDPPPSPALNVSTLMFHGLDDTALHSDGLNNTWDWISKDLTLVTVPGASHFVQQDAAELVTSTMHWWLLARQQADQ
ncbi:MAG: pimeloyl-ACP methyl ester carboxylesterase [Woeseiaceae bacterium]|jgi:pimeloyl-ACP methyl ester carboxylesterase